MIETIRQIIELTGADPVILLIIILLIMVLTPLVVVPVMVNPLVGLIKDFLKGQQDIRKDQIKVAADTALALNGILAQMVVLSNSDKRNIELEERQIEILEGQQHIVKSVSDDTKATRKVAESEQVGFAALKKTLDDGLEATQLQLGELPQRVQDEIKPLLDTFESARIELSTATQNMVTTINSLESMFTDYQEKTGSALKTMERIENDIVIAIASMKPENLEPKLVKETTDGNPTQ